MDKHQSGIGLGVVLFIIGIGILVTGWMVSEISRDPQTYPQDYYTLYFGLPQTIMTFGAILILAGITYVIYSYRATRLRERKTYCPYCGREVGTIGHKCTGCGGRL